MMLGFIFLTLVILEVGYFQVAARFGIVDKPNVRSSHDRVTLRGGGIVFLFSAWLYAVCFGFHYPWFLFGLTLVSLIGFIDDIRSLPDSVRLVGQFLAIFMIIYDLGFVSWANWWVVLIVWIVCVGVTNAFNFMDGINGMTGGYSLAVLAPLVYINVRTPFIDPNFLYVTGLSLAVFCFFNFRKRAKCFAGDVGSLGIAFILIFALGKLILLTGNFTYIVFLAIYGVDSVLTICHRILLRENLGQAHRKHAYQLMANELELSHVGVASIYTMLQLVVSFGLILLPVNRWVYVACVLLFLGTVYLLFMNRYYHLHEAYLNSKRIK